ncbi:polyadenylate-binding protein-interacting protein 4-like isoform X2 [Primulina huaijiensis]|uniref:polyadenylate-binding protein-interacting protein 4-like isoform X2 n=1 Tax=Primulina huaijiensis TaxID=1492673 RepID=UPI003CC787C8
MNMQQVMQTGSSSNGYSRRRTDKGTATRFDSKFNTGTTNSGRIDFGKGGGLEMPSRDRLVYLTTCLIGHQVEVQVQDGSVFSGIFHATNAEDLGIVLKMTHLINDGSSGQKNISDSPSRPPSRTLIIHAKDFVQLTAKGVPVTRDGLTKEMQHEKKRELLTDSSISQSRNVDMGRELQPWVPDDSDPSFPELENTFDDHWNRGWDQFEANESLFGVKSTFNEEIYTTKLEKGPQMREREREAIRIAREIEGEETLDLHVAEERGVQPDGNIEIDEETRFSSVYRRVVDCGYDEIEDVLLDSKNDETFGHVSDSAAEIPLMNGEDQSSLRSSSRDAYHSNSDDHSEQLPKDSSITDAGRLHDNQNIGWGGQSKEKLKVIDQSQVSKVEDSHLLLRTKIENSDKVGLSPNATAYDPSHAATKVQEKASSFSVPLEGTLPSKTQGATTYLARPSSSASSTSDRGGVATSTSVVRGLSPSSSVGSFSSEKSTLNPHAKEFKLNPNAKSFIPSITTLRSPSPVVDSSFYYPANMTAVPHMPGMPVGVGIGPSFALPQPVIFNPQAAPMPQPYYHPSGPQYGQQMIIGQPQPVMYRPLYPTDFPYRGMEF